MYDDMINPRKPRQVPSGHLGFSLIEAAIVLGIVGLVIGGIWVATSSVSAKMRINQIIEGVGYIRAKVEKVPNTSSTALSLMSVATEMSLVPPDWIRTGPSQINTPLKWLTLATSNGIVKGVSPASRVKLVMNLSPGSGDIKVCTALFRRLYGTFSPKITISYDDSMSWYGSIDSTNVNSFICQSGNLTMDFQ